MSASPKARSPPGSAALDKTGARRTETAYDYRGNVATVNSYSKLLSNGLFDTSSELSQTNYVYDQSGNLLSKQVTGSAASEVFTYDGLGRTLTATDFNGDVTRTSFLDATGQTVLTHANGLSEISTYNKAGELIAFSKSERRRQPRRPHRLAGQSGAACRAARRRCRAGAIRAAITDETQWATTIGPGRASRSWRCAPASPTPATEGGGNYTNEITIDATKAYEFTYYFKLSDLNKHDIYFGLSGGSRRRWSRISTAPTISTPISSRAVPGIRAAPSPPTNGTRWSPMCCRRARANPGVPLGGVYDVATGPEDRRRHQFPLESPSGPDNTVHARFFDYYGDGKASNYSTYFYQPEVRQVSTATRARARHRPPRSTATTVSAG